MLPSKSNLVNQYILLVFISIMELWERVLDGAKMNKIQLYHQVTAHIWKLGVHCTSGKQLNRLESSDLNLFSTAQPIKSVSQLSLPLIYAWKRKGPSECVQFQELPEAFELFTSWTLQSLPSKVLKSLELESSQVASEEITSQHPSETFCLRTYAEGKSTLPSPTVQLFTGLMLKCLGHPFHAREQWALEQVCELHLFSSSALPKSERMPIAGLEAHDTAVNKTDFKVSCFLAPRIFLFKNQMSLEEGFFSLKAAARCGLHS